MAKIEIKGIFKNPIFLIPVGLVITATVFCVLNVGGGEQRSQTPSPEPTNPPAPLNTSVPTLFPTLVLVPTYPPYILPPSSNQENNGGVEFCSPVGHRPDGTTCSALCLPKEQQRIAAGRWGVRVQTGTPCIRPDGEPVPWKFR